MLLYWLIGTYLEGYHVGELYKQMGKYNTQMEVGA